MLVVFLRKTGCSESVPYLLTPVVELRASGVHMPSRPPDIPVACQLPRLHWRERYTSAVASSADSFDAALYLSEPLAVLSGCLLFAGGRWSEELCFITGAVQAAILLSYIIWKTFTSPVVPPVILEERSHPQSLTVYALVYSAPSKCRCYCR
jgi:hypothetical protein